MKFNVRRPASVIVVGGGIMGASIAWHCARQQMQVTVLEKEPEPAGGVTKWSYGWVGTASTLPSDDPINFATKLDAIAEFDRLESELGSLPIATRGALIWCDQEENTSKLIAEQQNAGASIQYLSRSRVKELEPLLITPPPLAAWAPHDFAVEPIDLTHQLLKAAREAGAKVVCGSCVDDIETRGSRVIGIRTALGILAADFVIIANGASSTSLVAKLGIVLPVHVAPAVLMRFSAEATINHLLLGDDVELRPGRFGGLVSAEDYPSAGESGFAELGVQTAETIAKIFGSSLKPSLRSIAAGYRPMTDGGVPLRGFVPSIEGLYVVVAHPGVILAPYLGRLSAAEIAESMQ
ncbi:NAD(P)/FAD-dependent oxidoreductase [Ochrobactrum quorumnocens]|nr:FAD-dependent oxidoreductase [[Ochrobactrum] quorumnocens]